MTRIPTWIFLVAVLVTLSLLLFHVSSAEGVFHPEFGPSPPTDTVTPTTPSVTVKPMNTLTATPTRTEATQSPPTPEPTITSDLTTDRDRDRLSKRYELEVGSNPRRKTILIVINYTSGIDPLTENQWNYIETEFDEMQVSNPNGEPGIELIVVNERQSSTSIEPNRGAMQQFELAYFTEKTRADPCQQYYIVLGDLYGSSIGKASTYGWVVLADGDHDLGRELERTIIHELLHTVVGTFNTSKKGVVSKTHVDQGYLQREIGVMGDNSLHPVTRDKINEEGFSESVHPKCD